MSGIAGLAFRATPPGCVWALLLAPSSVPGTFASPGPGDNLRAKDADQDTAQERRESATAGARARQVLNDDIELVAFHRPFLRCLCT